MSSNYTTADYEAIIANYTPHAVRSEPWSHVADFTRELSLIHISEPTRPY